MLLFSHVKRLCFRARPHVVFHYCLYKKNILPQLHYSQVYFIPFTMLGHALWVLAAILVVVYRALHASHTRQTRQNNHFCHKGNQHLTPDLSFKFSALWNFASCSWPICGKCVARDNGDKCLRFSPSCT